MELNRKLLSSFRNTKAFRANFEKVIVVAAFNNIQVMTAGDFRIIDVLEGHPRRVKCLDVSQISKAIVSFSENLLIVHTLIKEENMTADHMIQCGSFKWQRSWKIELKLPIRNLCVSPIGDFFVISGDGVLSLWGRDNEGSSSFSNLILYTREEQKIILAAVLKKINLGNIIQQEVTKDGRLIITLEQRGKSLKIWYQDQVMEAKKQKEEVKAVVQQVTSPIKRADNRKKDEDKDKNLNLDFNPYANIVPLELEDQGGNNQQEQSFDVIDLCYYELPQHRQPIEYFKVLVHDLLETEKRILPNVILTITGKNEVYMWYENIANNEMQFNCAHIFRGFPNTNIFDVSFLDFPPINPKRYFELRSKVSKLLDTSRDETLKFKKHDNRFGIYQRNYDTTTLDWILVLVEDTLEIYKVEGLRNFPLRCLNVQIFNKYRMSYNHKDFAGVCKIFSSSCRDFNDILSLYGLNSSFQMIKLRKNFKEHGEWKLDKIRIINRKSVGDILVHKQLPLIAQIMKNNQIYFYIEEQTTKQVIKVKELKFIGSYSIYHSSKKHHSKIPLGTYIKSAKWVKNLAQIMIHYSNNSIGLITSHTQLKVLAHDKFPEEYLRIWDEKRSYTNEKWERIFEIQFGVEEGQQPEIILDFEILDTQNHDGSFLITLVIFTSSSQYYIYQTETKFLNGLKTMSTTTLLHSAYTNDTLIRFLSSDHSVLRDQSKTLITAITELDPEKLKLRKNNQNQASDTPIQEEEEDDSDDGDIFSYGSKKTKKKISIKKASIPEIVLKHQLLLKIYSFENKNGKTQQMSEQLSVEIPMDFKNKDFKSKMNKDFVAIMINDGPNNDKVIYIYEVLTQKYAGYINLTELLETQSQNLPLDFTFIKHQMKGSIVIYANDIIYLVSQAPRSADPGKWGIVKKFKEATGLDLSLYKIINIAQTPYNRLIVEINQKLFTMKHRFFDEESSKLQEGQSNIKTLNQLFQESQKSLPLYDHKLLRALFLKGYTNLVLKILVKLSKSLQEISSINKRVNQFVGFELEHILNEIEDHHMAQSQKNTQPTKQQNASSLFDDFYAFGETQTEQEDQKKKEEEKGTEKKIEQEFDECYLQLIELIQAKGQQALRLSESEIKDLLIFIKKFHVIFRKEFYSDTLASVLLREVHVLNIIFHHIQQFESEEVQVEEEKKEESRPQRDFNLQDFLNQMKDEQVQSKISLSGLKDWNSFKCAAALYSENQDVVYNEIAQRFDFEENLSWDLMRKTCLPIWLKENSKLKQLVERVAKTDYKTGGDDFGKSSKAERTAPWYIMLGKKHILCTLYKAEPAHKKVYEILLNDFTLPKWKTAAEKNAMVLMSKKNYMLSIAFFLLAGNLKSALQVANQRLNDPVLAVLMCRVIEGDESEQLMGIYQEYFIDRGERINDPYLISIGKWQKKDYVKAVNILQVGNEQSTKFIFDMKQQGLNLIQPKVQARAPQGDEDQSEVILPLPSKIDYFALDFIKALRKSPNIKRALNKNWALDKGLGDSIFDDFYEAPKKKEEEKKEENKIIVDEGKILTLTAYQATQNGYSIISLIVLREFEEFKDQVGTTFKQKIVEQVLLDLIQTLYQSNDFNNSIRITNQSIKMLCDRFELEEQKFKNYVLKQFQYSNNLGLQVGFLIEEKRDEVMFKLEDETMKLLDFNYAFLDFPFLSDVYNQDGLNEKVLPIIDYLEQILECLIMYDFQEPKRQQSLSSRGDHQNTPNLKTKVSIVDPDNEDGGYQFSVDEDKGTVILKNLDVANKLLSSKYLGMNTEIGSQLLNLSTKIRATLVVLVTLIQLSFLSKKFTIVREIISEMRNLLSNKFSQLEQNLDNVLVVNYQKLKIKIQKFKYALKRNDSRKRPQEFSDGFDVINTAKDSKVNPKKIQDFLNLWVRYITIYNTQFVMSTCYQESQIQNLVNIRPSIIQNRSLKDVIEIVLNPKLKSNELLKKFGNMHRILENVCTYYFENFLNNYERAIISEQLKTIEKNNFEMSCVNIVDFLPMFTSDVKFQKFCQFMDVKTFVKHLKDHELSLVYHSNYEYGQPTVERTQELFQSGIEVFKQKGEVVNGFAFDKSGQDFAVLAMLGRGIREIPLLKTLLFRNRQNNGRELLDEEQQTWHECLHRYDKYPDVSQAQKQNDPIISAVDKLYYYKTMNYTKKNRRKRTTMFLDCEMSPPDYWAGMSSTEFTRQRSSLDITHDDFTYCVETHPYLPIYMSGNQRGMMCLWKNEYEYDRSLDQWLTETDLKSINPKKGTIKKIQFSTYGDKIICNNMEGSIYMFRFDTYDQSKIQPIFNIRKSKEHKFNDFEFLNNDTVFAMSSVKPKHIWVHDLLVPQRNGLVQEYAVGGNIMQSNRRKQQIYAFNEKPGQMNIVDLRMNRIQQSMQLQNEEVTSVTTSLAQDTLVVGFKDGTIKILNINKDFETRETYVAFPPIAGKKVSVTQVKVHSMNGALYAGSNQGVMKLFRPKV